MATIAQRSFSGGEITPSLYARTDIAKYITSLRTLRNAYTMKHGGAQNRPGSQFVGEVNDSTESVRLIPFVFNTSQTYVLEFGDQYMRVIQDGAHLTESGVAISGATQADPCVVTATAHGYSNGDEVYISGISGMTELNGRNFKVANVAANTFELQDMGGTDIDATAYTAYSSGGYSYKIYEIATDYLEADLSTLQFVQSADVITVVHPTYPPAELTRTGHTSWTLTDISIFPEVDHPWALGATASTGGSVVIKYAVTAIDATTNEESLMGFDETSWTFGTTISGITKANPAVVTATSHGLSTGDHIGIGSVSGMTEVNSRRFTVTVLTANTFELNNVDSTDYTTYTSGGYVYKAFASISASAAGAVGAAHTVTWGSVDGAASYNIYRFENGVWGLIGVAGTTNSFEDVGQTADTSITPPLPRDLFLFADDYPSTVTYYQQRLGFANSNNATEKVWFSQTGNFKNFTSRSPIQDDDMVSFTLAGRQVNAVRHLVDLGQLVILTSGGEFAIQGDSAGILKPAEVNSRQHSYYGSSTLAPIIIGGTALFVQNQGTVVRDLGYSYESDRFRGSDLTIFSTHLFQGYTLSDWAYSKVPNPIIWCVRSDGVLLGLTYDKEQEMLAWHRHDFDGGTVENVCVVPEGDEDVLYVVVKRTINSRSVKYVERLTSRHITDIFDAKFMDSNLSYDGRNTTASHTMTLSGGTDWDHDETLTLTSSTSYFASTDVGNAIHMFDSDGTVVRCAIEAYTSGTVVTVRPHTTVPSGLRSTATSTWTKAVDSISGLWHLEGESVSILGDGNVVANPKNDAYDTVTVTSGTITLDQPYGVIHIGLPYITDLQTLNIDTPQGEPIGDKNKIVNEVNVFVESTRGVWAGAKPPTSDTTDPLENLIEYKARQFEAYDDPVTLKTGVMDILIKSEWNDNGRVFIRQIDPLPMTVLSIMPAGLFPVGGG